MILVTGATGQLGGIVIRSLLDKTSADQVAALVRDESKAAELKAQGVSIRIGDYDNTAALEKAMQGIDKVLLIAGTNEERRVQQHQNVVDAAKKSGVRCIAYTSRALKHRSTLTNTLMEGHFQTEDYITQSGLNYTLFRNILYMDTVPLYVGEEGVDNGFSLPAGQGKVAYALRSDLGEAMATALLSGECSSSIYTLTNTESYSFSDVAAVLTELSGKTVKYTPIETSAFEERLKERGVPEMMVRRMAGFLTDIKNGQEDWVRPDLEHLLGRKPTSLREGLKGLFKL
jgi:NAD(P)H dehydrogenase (quinone)